MMGYFKQMEMRTLKEIITYVYSCGNCWNYYGGCSYEDIFCKEGCKQFVEQFFSRSGKSNLLRFLLQEELSTERWQHIVYVFLLGIYVYGKTEFEGLIDDEIDRLDKRIKSISKIKFEFIWFLVCLTHDLFHSSEEDLSKESFLDFKNYKLRALHGVPRLFQNIPIRYYFYRRLYGKNDHGIYAGLTMFKTLCDIRRQQERSQVYTQSDDIVLCWDKPLEKVYNYVAWIVTCHNIWFRYTDKKEDVVDCLLYKLFGLDELILNDSGREYKKECRDHPIFYLFCILDTIEVIKIACTIDELDKIWLGISDDRKDIIIDVSESQNKMQLSKNIRSLNDWIADVVDIDNYTFRIKL